MEYEALVHNDCRYVLDNWHTSHINFFAFLLINNYGNKRSRYEN